MAREEKKMCWKIIKDEIVDHDAYMKMDFKKGTKQTILKEKFVGTYEEINNLLKEFEKETFEKLSEEKKKQKKVKWFFIWKKIYH